MTFVDLTKAFETVVIDIMKLCQSLAAQLRLIAIARRFQDDMLPWVQNDEEPSVPFPVLNGVKQGWIPARTILSMSFSSMFTDEFKDCDDSNPIKYRFDGKLFNLRRLQAKQIPKYVLYKLLYADDMTKSLNRKELQGATDRALQACVNHFSQKSKRQR